MKILISIIIVFLVGFVGCRVFDHWEKVSERRELDEKAAKGTDINPDALEGLPYQLVPKLYEAQKGGAAVFKRFLDSCKQYPDVKDPRLGWMQLDYVVMVSATDPIEAKKVFQEVKKRVSPDSPIYPRIKSLEKTYE